MIGTISLKNSASHPQMPLQPLFAYASSPISVRVIDVPSKIGEWKITSVSIMLKYPSNAIVSVECKNTNGVYVGTLSGSDTVGCSNGGVEILANGVDENGTDVSDYVLGRGDLFILDRDGTVHPQGKSYYLHYLDTVPTNPSKGDVCEIDGTYKLYDGEEWKPFFESYTKDEIDNKFVAKENAQVEYLRVSKEDDDGWVSGNSDGILEVGYDNDFIRIEPHEITWHYDAKEITLRQPRQDGRIVTEPMLDDYATQSDLSSIESKIPSQATSTNQLADKNFVNSSIATNTAIFRGTYYDIEDLPTTDITINDYAFVVGEDDDGNTIYDRYKWIGDNWEFEYTLNNSSFTADQWATINSGATADKIAEIDNKVNKGDYVEVCDTEGYKTTYGLEGITVGVDGVLLQFPIPASSQYFVTDGELEDYYNKWDYQETECIGETDDGEEVTFYLPIKMG